MDMDGNDNSHHVGGITTNNETVWISNDYEVEEYSLKEILNTTEDTIQSKGVYDLPIRGDFCTYHDGVLWIGDFYLKPFYDVPNGNPLLFGYKVEDTIHYSLPEVVISLPKMVQGLAFDDKDHFVLTESFTYLINSNFSIYQNVLEKDSSEIITVNSHKIPYYQLNRKNLIKNIKLPPMAEEFFYYDSSYYILFESSTDYYSMAYPKIKNVIQYKVK